MTGVADVNESQYQSRLMKRIAERFPGCEIVRLPPDRRQGYPDLLVLFKGFWAALEVKVSERAPKQPNQEHYVNKFSHMSFASFIHPGNEEEVLGALQSALRPKRQARVPQPQ